jgi:glycosyltransferase involved in cell wall biosynthesis
MKILLSAYACRPNAETEPGYGWNWATHLAARGIEVYVLTAERYREQIEPIISANPLPGLKFFYVRVPPVLSRGSERMHYVLWQLAALNTARKLIRDIPFEVAHHVTYGSVHVPSQLWRLGIPLVFGPIGGGQTTPAGMLKYFGNQKRKEQIRTAITHALHLSPIHLHSLRKMSFILAANQDTLRLVQELGCEHTSLMCDAGLPDSFFSSDPRKFQHSDRPQKLLWVGRMLPRKGLRLALDAIALVREPVTLTIVGNGLDAGVLKQMITDRKLENKIVWQGRRLAWSEVRAAYLEHDAMLFTSLRDSFGVQLLEAMALGLPVITLDQHGAHDFVPDDAGLKVLVGHPDQTVQNLVNAIETYASLSAQKRDEMSNAGWTFARNFTWTARAKFVEGIYKGILSKSINSDSLAPGCPNAASEVSNAGTYSVGTVQ